MNEVQWKSAGLAGEYKRVEGCPALRGFIHGFSTRCGGSSNPPYESLNLGLSCGDDPEKVEQNQRHFFKTIGCPASPVQTLKQIHSSKVILIRRGQAFAEGRPPGDALVTNQENLLIGVYTADCYPILLADPKQRVVAAIHAGWRGVAGGIVSRALKVMKDNFGCRGESALAIVGPGIGPCCYQVGKDVYSAIVETRSAARSWFLPDTQASDCSGPTWRLDLRAGLRDQLRENEISGDRIFVSGDCTRCRSELYFSYRRDGKTTGRMLSIVGITS